MVLVIHNVKRNAQAISDIFYYMGVLSCAATPEEALSEISERYRAVIVMNPEALPDAESFVERLRAYDHKIPIFAISDRTAYTNAVFDECFPNDIYSSRLVEEIARFQSERGLPTVSQYRLAGINASCNTGRVKIFDEHVDFTRTETMILRYLIRSYPTPQDAKSILRYAFKPHRSPEPASIRTHVSAMNKKFRELKGKNLFLAIPSRGYVLLTPEILDAYAVT